MVTMTSCRTDAGLESTAVDVGLNSKYDTLPKAGHNNRSQQAS